MRTAKELTDEIKSVVNTMDLLDARARACEEEQRTIMEEARQQLLNFQQLLSEAINEIAFLRDTIADLEEENSFLLEAGENLLVKIEENGKGKRSL